MVSTVPEDLLQVFAALEDPEDVALLLGDLLSPAEMRSVGERWAIVTGLAAGQTQREVKNSVGVAIATVSRGAQQLKHGPGGFALAFDTLDAMGLRDPRKAKEAS